MKRLMRQLEDLVVAITFAEPGEFDEAEKFSGSNHDKAASGQDENGAEVLTMQEKSVSS